MTIAELKQAIAGLPGETGVRIALDRWANAEDPANTEVSRKTHDVHFLEFRPREKYAFVFLVYSEPEESAQEERSL